MNVIDEYDYVATFDYPAEKKMDNADSDKEIDTVYLWLDDLGWI
jgi:hypothetical protein